jgi:hypothetical protein
MVTYIKAIQESSIWRNGKHVMRHCCILSWRCDANIQFMSHPHFPVCLAQLRPTGIEISQLSQSVKIVQDRQSKLRRAFQLFNYLANVDERWDGGFSR